MSSSKRAAIAAWRVNVLALLVAIALTLSAAEDVEARRDGRRAVSRAVSRTRARKAKRLYKAGKRAYKAERYLDAVVSWKRAYKLDPRPGFLLNIAQSYRRAWRPKSAIAYYRKYLATGPNADARGQVEGLVKEIEAKLPKPKPKVDPKKDHPDKKKTPAFADVTKEKPAMPHPPAGSPFYKKWWFWTVVGVVVVGAATGTAAAAASSAGPNYVKEGGLGSVRW